MDGGCAGCEDGVEGESLRLEGPSFGSLEEGGILLHLGICFPSKSRWSFSFTDGMGVVNGILGNLSPRIYPLLSRLLSGPPGSHRDVSVN